MDNSQKKKAVDDIVAKYNEKIAVLKQKRNKAVSDFLEVLKEKKIKEIKNSITNQP